MLYNFNVTRELYNPESTSRGIKDREIKILVDLKGSECGDKKTLRVNIEGGNMLRCDYLRLA